MRFSGDLKYTDAMNTVAPYTPPSTDGLPPPSPVVPPDDAPEKAKDELGGYVTSRTAVSAAEDSEEMRDLFFGC